MTLNPAPAGSAGALQLSSLAYSVNENGGSVMITLARTGGSTGAVGISYVTADGTATGGSDYTAASGTLSWADGDTASKSFNVAITNDAVVEGSEAFTVTLNGPSGGATLGSPNSGTVTISDDDGAPAVPAGNTILYLMLAGGMVYFAARRNFSKKGPPSA
jgi:hypothetical protein